MLQYVQRQQIYIFFCMFMFSTLQCVKVYQFTQETLFFKKPIVLTVLYSLMSILTFIRETPSIGGGIFLLIAAIINIFAQVNQTTDASDSSKTKNKNNPNGADLISNEA